MANPKDKPADEAPAEPQGPQAGERLADARRKLQISVAEIAKELHLDEPKVHALERNDFDFLGAPVFAKGHLRKYAQLVNVDESDVMADYYQLTRAAGSLPLVATRRRPRREMTPGPWIAVIIVVVAVATAYWWFTSKPVRIETTSNDSMPQETGADTAALEADEADEADETDEPDEIAAPAEASLVPVAADSVADEPLEQSPIAADDSAVLESASEEMSDVAAEIPDDPVEPPDLADGQMRILLTYSGDCWTEISDAGGRRLFFGLGNDGRTVELSGEAPFNVLVGNANNVSIRVNGTERIIAAAERRGRTARLTITGP